MNFGAWVPLTDAAAAAAAPDCPGVMQARAKDLLGYPRGRSAMLLYEHSHDETLRRYLGGTGRAVLEHAVSAGARLVRFGASNTPAVDCDRLLRQFVARFGGPPLANPSRPSAVEPVPEAGSRHG